MLLFYQQVQYIAQYLKIIGCDQMNVQFKKGVLTLCVLVLTLKKDRYGYELVHTISEKFLIAEGTIYPLLRRLTKEGYFTTYLVESTEGPPRKYYQLTEVGQKYADELVNEWKEFSAGVNQLIEEGILNEQK
jgi:PadR family transcriptional regulator PadR